MYPKLLLFILAILFIPESFGIYSPVAGKICHVEADYYYPGIWEHYSETELICNYWKFLSDEIELQLNEDEDSESENDYGEHDSYDEMNEK